MFTRHNISVKYIVLINLMGIIFTAMGTYCVVHGIQERITGKKSLSWPTTVGIVLKAEVYRSEGSRSRQRDGSSESSPTYSPVVKYSYTVEGTKYKGQRIRFAAIGSGDRSEADAIVAKYAPGISLNVAYNPEEPSESVLEPGQFVCSLVLIAAGFTFMAIGISVLIYQKRLLAQMSNKQSRRVEFIYSTNREHRAPAR